MAKRKWQQVVELAHEGFSSSEIASQLDTTPGSVRVMLSYARTKRGIATGYSVDFNHGITTFLSYHCKAQLESAATERGKSLQILVTQILETVVNDDLFAAILDD